MSMMRSGNIILWLDISITSVKMQCNDAENRYLEVLRLLDLTVWQE